LRTCFCQDAHDTDLNYAGKFLDAWVDKFVSVRWWLTAVLSCLVELIDLPVLYCLFACSEPQLHHRHRTCHLCASSVLPSVLHADTALQLGKQVLLITFDEDERLESNHITSLLLGPSYIKAGTTEDSYYTHWSFLKTVQESESGPEDFRLSC
jgi:hypothetical protein